MLQIVQSMGVLGGCWRHACAPLTPAWCPSLHVLPGSKPADATRQQRGAALCGRAGGAGRCPCCGMLRGPAGGGGGRSGQRQVQPGEFERILFGCCNPMLFSCKELQRACIQAALLGQDTVRFVWPAWVSRMLVLPPYFAPPRIAPPAPLPALARWACCATAQAAPRRWTTVAAPAALLCCGTSTRFCRGTHPPSARSSAHMTGAIQWGMRGVARQCGLEKSCLPCRQMQHHSC